MISLRQPVQPARDLARVRQRRSSISGSSTGSPSRRGRPTVSSGARASRRDQVQPGQHPKRRLPPDVQELAGLGGQPQGRADRPGLALGAEVGAAAHLLQRPVGARTARRSLARPRSAASEVTSLLRRRMTRCP